MSTDYTASLMINYIVFIFPLAHVTILCCLVLKDKHGMEKLKVFTVNVLLTAVIMSSDCKISL